ncbi:MAG: hypothetical protein VX747_04100 [Actinomycetota bacterium]|nr:hypothetical protein [Actinomycetota bacterium]
MISLGHVSVPRCAAVWIAVTAVGAGTCRVLAADLRVLVSSSARAGADLESWVVALAAAAVCLAVCWASAVTGLVCVQLLRRPAAEQRPPRVAGVPAPVRRLVLRACGVAVAGGLAGGLALSPAGATPGSLERDRPSTPATSVAPSSPPTTAPTPTHATAPVSASVPEDRRVVRPGDSLWRIAEAELLRHHDHEPTVAEVAAYWPRIHAANRALVGPDPDLVRPGVPLVLPAPSIQES